MKVKKTFLVLMVCAIFFCAGSVGAYNMVYRTVIQLNANQNQVQSNSYAGNYGKGGLSVVFGSAGNAKLLLQSSTGYGWSTLTTISVAPGGYDTTNIWGRDDTDYLYRITVQSDPMYDSGNPGRIAYGYLYTGFEE